MFYKIETQAFPAATDFKLGNGFYLVHQLDINQHVVHYYNNGIWLTLQNTEDAPFLKELFESVQLEESEIKEQPNYVSEEFALKAMAIAKANSQSIKVSDVLK